MAEIRYHSAPFASTLLYNRDDKTDLLKIRNPQLSAQILSHVQATELRQDLIAKHFFIWHEDAEKRMTFLKLFIVLAKASAKANDEHGTVLHRKFARMCLVATETRRKLRSL